MTDETPTLADWLLEQINDDAIVAQKAARFRFDIPEDAPWERAKMIGLTAVNAHAALNNPVRTLATCVAHRAIVDEHPGSTDEDECPGCGAWLDGHWKTGPGEACPTLHAVASIYADRPGYAALALPA